MPTVIAVAGAPSIVEVEATTSVRNRTAASDPRAVLRAIVNAGTIAAVLTLVPGLGVLALPLAGFVCVLLYRRTNAGEEPTAAMGLRLGAKAGAIGSLIFAVVKGLAILTMHAEDNVRTAAIEAVQRTGSFYSGQQVKDTVEFLNTPQGLVFF